MLRKKKNQSNIQKISNNNQSEFKGYETHIFSLFIWLLFLLIIFQVTIVDVNLFKSATTWFGFSLWPILAIGIFWATFTLLRFKLPSFFYKKIKAFLMLWIAGILVFPKIFGGIGDFFIKKLTKIVPEWVLTGTGLIIFIIGLSLLIFDKWNGIFITLYNKYQHNSKIEITKLGKFSPSNNGLSKRQKFSNFIQKIKNNDATKKPFSIYNEHEKYNISTYGDKFPNIYSKSNTASKININKNNNELDSQYSTSNSGAVRVKQTSDGQNIHFTDNQKNSSNLENVKKYIKPSLNLLQIRTSEDSLHSNNEYAKSLVLILESTLANFNIKTQVKTYTVGPTVTRFELNVEAGVRVNQISKLQDNLKMALAVKDIRIQAPIPGKSTVGIEVPNETPMMVCLNKMFQTMPLKFKNSKLAVVLGKDISGNTIFTELNKMPHLLIAGSTGSGKSVCINTILISLLMQVKPSEVQLLLIDPKMVELSVYNGIPHLMAPVVTNAKKASIALKEIVNDMESRYSIFVQSGTKNIESYNQKNPHNKIPYIVIVIDELADLMIASSKDVEESIMRITQKARAAGIHLIVATQRPSTDVITGIIKANIPSRIAFAVSSSIDSRTILDQMGAEKLLGNGDMLFSPIGFHPSRIQGAFISDHEVASIVQHLSEQGGINYNQKYVELKESNSALMQLDTNDPLYEDIKQFVIEGQRASSSLFQRRFSIGYGRAAKILDMLENNRVVGPAVGSKPRKVLIQ